jgi:tetratricopeptide (TPR) repeat protein
MGIGRGAAGAAGIAHELIAQGLETTLWILIGVGSIYWLLRLFFNVDVLPLYVLSWPISKPIDLIVNYFWRRGPTPLGRRNRALSRVSEAEAQRSAGDSAAARTILQTASGELEEGDDRRLYCDVHLRLVALLTQLGELDEAWGVLGAAEEAIARSGDLHLEARVLLARARLAWRSARADEARLALEQMKAIDNRRRHLAYKQHVEAAQLAAEMLASQDDVPGALSVLQEAATLARTRNDYILAAAVTCDMADLLAREGQSAEARAAAQEARGLAQTFMSPETEQRAAGILARVGSC